MGRFGRSPEPPLPKNGGKRRQFSRTGYQPAEALRFGRTRRNTVLLRERPPELRDFQRSPWLRGQPRQAAGLAVPGKSSS